MFKGQEESIAGEAMRRMYEDPFWDARFGERGRKMALEDGLHHLSYLGAALEAKDAGVLLKYAQWLRSVLVPRGMCSFHLSENLARIGELLAERGLDSDGRSRRFLLKACESLRHAGGFDEAQVAREAALLFPPGARELRVLVSYAGDALAAKDPELFRRHLAWAIPWYEQRGLDSAALLEALRAPLVCASPTAAEMVAPMNP